MQTIELDPEWTVFRIFDCRHIQHACCKWHLDDQCPVCQQASPV